MKCQLCENHKRIIDSGYDFNKWIMLIPEYEVIDVGRNTNMPLHPATYWTHVDEEQYVDFIGKMETFEEDFWRFCQFTGLGTPAQINGNVTDLSITDKHGHRYISKMSHRAIGRINEMFRNDFELLGYERVS